MEAGPAVCGAGPAAERYTKIEKIGEGTYGIVYKARCNAVAENAPGAFVAMKKIRIEADDNGVPCTALREISALKGLQHVNIVKLLDILLKEGVLYLVFEFVEKDLRGFLEPFTNIGLDYTDAKRYLYQLVDAIAYCHGKQMLHRDLKPSNLLIDRHGTLKLADFGMARTICVRARPYTNAIVTLWYRPPEILLGDTFYTTSVDLWSVGCVFVEMAAGHPMFKGDSEIDQLFRIFQILGTPNESVWPGISTLPLYQASNFPHWPSQNLQTLLPNICPEGIALLQSLFMFHPRHRISASEALQHPLFDGIRPAALA